MPNQKYFLIVTLMLLFFIIVSLKYLPADINLKDAVDQIPLQGKKDYQNYKLISIKYFNY